jgi:N-acetylmuramic acid 6-phosphate etherase
MEVCAIDRAQASRLLDEAGGHVKTAIVMQKRGLGRGEAEKALEDQGGVIRRITGEGPPPCG